MENKIHIIFDAFLEYVLEYCCESECPWVRYERSHVDRGELLKLLSTMLSVSKKTRENAARTVQLVVLRLASQNVHLMKNSSSPVEATSFVLTDFDINMNVFNKDWNVDSPIPQHLYRRSLHELSARDLQHLRNLFYGDWYAEIVVHQHTKS